MISFLYILINTASGDRINTFSDILFEYNGVLSKYSDFYDRSQFKGFWHATEQYGSKDRETIQQNCPNGCVCDEEILDCSSFSLSSTKLSLYRQSFQRIINSSFPETIYPTVIEISIISCKNMFIIENYLLEKFPNIENLVITDTQLGGIPNFQSEFQSLVNIDFYNNNIERISDSQFHYVPKLKYLNIAMNDLKYVAENAFSGTSLNFVSLAYNKLTYVPKSFSSIFSYINYIGIEGNTIDVLSAEALSGLTSLKHFNISNNPIKFVEYGTFINCPSLNFIEIHSSALETIGEFHFQNIPNLVYISLFRTKTLVSVMGNAFFNLPSLKVIEFQFGSLKFLDFRAFKNIPNLEYFLCDQNELTAIPHMFLSEGQYNKLKVLELSNNKIHDISKISEDFAQPGNEILITHYEQLFSLNESAVVLPKLEYLDLSGNLLKGLPGFFFTAFASLRHIYLNNNLISDEMIDLNSFTESCTSINSIYLNHNKLKSIPHAIYRLPNVIILGLSHNLLTYLTRGTFTSMINLADLYIANNNILKIEDDVFPASLKVLDIGYNKFNFLDENQFRSLTKLVSLSLNHNRITYLPDAVFANNFDLTNINLNNNHLGWIKRIVFENTPLSGNILISYNKIRNIEHGTFKDKDFLQFSASNNELATLPDDCMFCNLNKSQVQIYLQGNLLELLHENMFASITSAHTINLSSNKITRVMANAFNHIGLINKLDISANPIYNMEMHCFNHFTSLSLNSMIDFSDIQLLSTIKSQTFNDIEVHKIHFNSNKISRIEKEAFFNVKIMNSLLLSDVQLNFMAKHVIVGFVKQIYLQNNKLQRLTQGAFEKTSCESIDLSNNKISFIDKVSLPSCTKMINLDNNSISKLINNIITDGGSLSKFSLRKNEIVELEMDAFVILKDSLKELDLRDNNLPSFPGGLIDGFSHLTTLSLSGNKIRTLEKQNGLSSLILLDIDANYNHLRYFDKEILNSLGSEGKQTVLTISNLAENPLPCACSNFEAFLSLSENDLILFHDLQFCDYDGETISFDKSSSNYFVDTKTQLLCEPLITKITRKTTDWVADLPDKESLEISWKVNNMALWNNPQTFCCKGVGLKTCLTISGFNVKCYSDHDNTLLVDEVIQISKKEDCGFEFGISLLISYSSSSVACTVDTTVDTKTSSPSPYKVAYPENKVSNTVPCQRRDFPISVTYFDFNNNVYDFQNFGDDRIVSDVKYQNHFLGPFLYKSATDDSLSSWFTVNSEVSAVVQEDLCLDRRSKSRYKWFARNWYPLDIIVDEILLDRDENFILHNLYFTARLSFTFVRNDKKQQIFIGGPDDVWIYIGGIQVLELLAETDDNAPLPCAKLAISDSGVRVVYGVLNFAQEETTDSRCITTENNQSSEDSPDFLFNAENYYPVDIFLTQRRSLSSSLYLEFINIGLESSLAPRYYFDISENKLPGGLVAEINISNSQKITGPYTIKMKTNKQFGVLMENTFSIVEDRFEYLPNVNAGEGVPDYFDCSTVELAWDPLDERAYVVLEENTLNFFLILRKILDYEALDEASQRILFVIEVTVENFGLKYSFENSILAVINDANDNCPVFTDGISQSYSTFYALSIEGKNIVVTDADSRDNGAVEFYISQILHPENEAFYLSHVDYYLHETVLLTYVIKVNVVDKGSKRYGAATDIEVIISSGCIRNLEFSVHKETGVFHVKAPGWMVSAHNSSYCESCTVGYRCPGNGLRIKCTSCLQEYEDNEMALPSGIPELEEECESPSLADFSFGGSSECQDCKPGWICKEGLGHPVLERMKYVNLCTSTSCDGTLLNCELGHSCIAGVTEICGVGTYNDGEFERCQLCPAGKFNLEPGAASCTCCPAGMESSHGKDKCEYCSWTDISSECEVCRSCSNSEQCPCLGELHGCSTGQTCVNLPEGTNICLECPKGSEAVDGSCSDIDECVQYNPCFDGVTCTNLVS